MDAITYNLQNNECDSSLFYLKLEETVEIFLNKAKSSSQFIINQYIEHLNLIDTKKTYSINELYLEFLYLGVYNKVYSVRANTCPRIWINISKKLNYWRKNRPEFKKPIDFLRAFAFRNMNSGKKSKTTKFNLLKCLNSLINWMEASGEFAGETIKMKQWYGFLQTMSIDRANAIINRSMELAEYFENLSKEYLGEFTDNMDKYLRISNKSDSVREDIFLRQRKEIEYHLNLVGAEIRCQNIKFREINKLQGCIEPSLVNN